MLSNNSIFKHITVVLIKIGNNFIDLNKTTSQKVYYKT